MRQKRLRTIALDSNIKATGKQTTINQEEKFLNEMYHHAVSHKVISGSFHVRRSRAIYLTV